LTSLVQRIRQCATEFPDNPAVLSGDTCLDHARLGQLSDRIAAGLAARGVSPGDRMAIYSPNCPEFVVLYVGILKAGATVVPINLLIGHREVSYVLSDAGVKGLLVHHQLADRVAALQRDVPTMAFVARITNGSEPEVTLDELLVDGIEPPEPVLDPENALAAILYTSGTTGFPKGAMLTHANLVSNTRSVHVAMKWRSGEDRVLVVLPMFHAFAATVGMLTPLMNGCALISVARFEPDSVAEAIHRHQATIFLGVPSMYSVLLRLREGKLALLKSLRFGVVGGAAMPAATLRQFEERTGIRLYEGDGPTECSPVTCVNPIDGLSKPGTVGLPVPDVEMKIVGDDGHELADGVVGEIAVRGPNVMTGYWNQPEATAEVLHDDWFLTGDLGTRDEDGYFSIVDRKKDLIIVNGMNVYPRMIEEVLYAFPGMLEAAVVGERSELHGEVPVAYVSLESDPPPTEKMLRDYCRGYLGRHQVPKRIIILPELPKNAAGKILKRELRKQGEIERGVIDL
jgi:long-chain acyl-CoA synthetase